MPYDWHALICKYDITQEQLEHITDLYHTQLTDKQIGQIVRIRPTLLHFILSEMGQIKELNAP